MSCDISQTVTDVSFELTFLYLCTLCSFSVFVYFVLFVVFSATMHMFGEIKVYINGQCTYHCIAV